MDSRPIGIFDSGVGGLTVIKSIKNILLNESIIYLGDTARVPYGTRSRETVQKFTVEDTEFLLSKNVKCIVVACNTASAHAYELIRNKYNIPIFEVINPASKAAIKSTKTKKIAVMATSGTIRSKAYVKSIRKENQSIELTEIACPLLVPLIEEGETKGKIIDMVLAKYLEKLSGKEDTIILGCTHYPVIADLIKKKVKKNVELIDSGVEVTKSIGAFLHANNMNGSVNAKYSYFATDVSESFRKSAELFLDEKIGVKIMKVNIS